LYLGILIVTILVVVTSRFWQLGNLPPGIHIDEVSFGYEAQSLYETGKDTWGQSWPSYFKGFGEFKAPGIIYIYYLLLPFFGHINTIVTRIPAAISGILTILIFVMTAKLIANRLNRWQLLLVGIIFAFSPWHFGLSRVYYETSAGFIFIALGLYYNFSALRKNSFKHWLISLISFAISGYFYASYRYIVLGLSLTSYLFINKFKINIKQY